MIRRGSSASSSAHCDKEQVKASAVNRWADILLRVAGIQAPSREGSPCPKCGGTDRFNRHNDFDKTGGVLCRHCFSSGNQDGFAAVSWATGMSFTEAVDAVGEFLGVQPGEGNSGTTKQRKRETLTDVKVEEWPEQLAAYWCSQFVPITTHGLRRCGAESIKFNGTSYLSFPGRNEHNQITAWTILDWAGGFLIAGRGENRKQVKTKLVDKSQPGSVIGSLDGEVVWKVEGPKDLAAFYSQDNIPENHSAFSTSHGASESPASWIIERLEGKIVCLIADQDEAGIAGVQKWSKRLAECGVRNRIITLPFPAGTKKDLRDYFANGYSIDDLRELARSTVEVEVAPPELRVRPGEVIQEAVDDPMRLARENLANYEQVHRGKLVYWMGGWYAWKGTKYEPKGEEEIKTHLFAFIEREFQQEYKQAIAERREIEHKRKVSSNIVSNTYAALKSLCIISDKIHQPSWIDGRVKRDVVAVTNGLIDLEEVCRMVFGEHGDPSTKYLDALKPHDPSWFSTVCLKYAYEYKATCPMWDAFLLRSLDGNKEKEALLQEWAGYLLVPDTSQHKFLCIQGSGANGKSVFLAAMTAMLGEENVSNVPLEQFGDRFSLFRTLGKLANIVDEVPASEMPEAKIKAFTAGNRMSFEDKGKPLFEAAPTARLMFSCNEKPKFKDPTGAIWRRMLFVPFGKPVAQSERVSGMDKPEWWVRSGELPGILMWAIRGLHRLRNRGYFSQSPDMENEIEEYRRAGNPIREFLLESYQPGNANDAIACSETYDRYREWASRNGFYPASMRKFGESVKEVFPNSSRVRARINGSLAYAYVGIWYQEDDFLKNENSEF